MMLVLHDDPRREYAYGLAEGLPETTVGTVSQALLNEAKWRAGPLSPCKKTGKNLCVGTKTGHGFYERK
jgi:hypothetical protein